MKAKVMRITNIKYVPIGNLNSLPAINTMALVDKPEKTNITSGRISPEITEGKSSPDYSEQRKGA